MKRIDNSTATVDNLFTEGNPLSATPATILAAEWLNVLQEEIAHVIEESGGTLDQTGTDKEQLYTAIIALITAAVPTIDFANNTSSNAGTATDEALTPANFGSQQSKTANGYLIFPGGLIVQWGNTAAITTDARVTVTFPLAFPNACFQAIACYDGGATLVNHGASYGVANITASNFQIENQGIASPFGNLVGRWVSIGH